MRGWQEKAPHPSLSRNPRLGGDEECQPTGASPEVDVGPTETPQTHSRTSIGGNSQTSAQTHPQSIQGWVACLAQIQAWRWWFLKQHRSEGYL